MCEPMADDGEGVKAGLDDFVGARSEDYYYLTSALRLRVDLIRHLLEYGHQIIVITGPPGIGKSMLLQHAVATDQGGWQVLHMTAGPTLSRANVLEKIAASLGIELLSTRDEDPINAIHKRIRSLGQTGTRLILALDDAHTLPVDTIACLATLARADDVACEAKLVVSADPEQSRIVDQLQNGSTDKALVHVVEIPRLSEDHMREMLQHRWAATFGEEALPLTDAELVQIHRQSNGIAAKAIVLARQLQVIAEETRRNPRDPAMRYIVTGIAVISFIMLIAYVTSRSEDDDAETEIVLDLPSPASTAMNSAFESDGESISALPLPLDPPSLSSPPVVQTPDTAPAAATEPDQPTATLPETPESSNSLDAARVATDAPDTSQQQAGPPLAADTPDADDRASLAGESSQQEKRAEAPPLVVAQDKPARDDRVGVETEASAQEKPSAPVPAATKKPRQNATYSTTWLRGQNPQSYVLQLFGVRDRAAADSFIETQRIENRSTVLATQHEGAPWYIVLYGHYPNRAAAVAAIAKLPEKLTKTKPWARSIASIK